MGFERLFVDTWGWLVLVNRRDIHFGEVAQLRSVSRGGEWVTSDYILDETISRLFATYPFPIAHRFMDGLFQASGAGALDIEHVTPERFGEAWRLRAKYKDKPRISFTDLTSFVLMKELGIRRVLTGDAHFEHAGMGFERIPKSPH